VDIEQLSQLGESKTLEYKRNAQPLESILKAVIAFANTSGGIILIGVEDDGQIVGIDNEQAVQAQLANSISNRITPKLVPDISIMRVKKVSVVVVRVEHSIGPYYLRSKGVEKGAYIRVGNSNQVAGPEIINELLKMGNLLSFDKTACSDADGTMLDRKKIEKVFHLKDETISTSKLLSLGLVVKKGSRIFATNGGMILFGFPEKRQFYFPYAEVRCARFKGTTRAEFIDQLNIDGGILSAIDEAPKFIRRNTRVASKFGGIRRQDIPEYPFEGIREALTNALAHANYAVDGSRIFVAIYDDRLEIQNPGIMMPGMDIEQFKAGISRIRNPVIARILGELRLIEEWGSGYKRIKAACEDGGYPLPKWEEFGTALRVTFYPYQSEATQTSASLEAKLGPSRDQDGTKSGPRWDQVGIKWKIDREALRLLEFCVEPKTFVELMNFMGWRNRTKFRTKYIYPLIELNLIEMTIPEKPNSRFQKYQITQKVLKVSFG
jgi:predicted HTH transcriptional regulator